MTDLPSPQTLPLDPGLPPLLQRAADFVAAQPQPLTIEGRRLAMLQHSRWVNERADATALLPVVERRDETKSLAEGSTLRLRRYRSVAHGDSAPLIVYFHGGGWVVGDLETHDALMVALVAYGGCEVLAADYRLAPEHGFEATLADGLAALQSARDASAERPIVLAGDSAGGHLAAATAYAAESAGHAVQGLLLLYPVTTPTLDSPSHRERGANQSLTTEGMRWFWSRWLGTELPADGLRSDDPRIDLLQQRWRRAPPPAVVVPAWHDPLHDEAVQYARHLQAAGGTVHLHAALDMPHGFARYWRVNAAARAHVGAALGALRGLISA